MSREITPEEEAFLKAADVSLTMSWTREMCKAHRAIAESRKPKPAWTVGANPIESDSWYHINYCGRGMMTVRTLCLAADLCDWLNATGKKP